MDKQVHEAFYVKYNGIFCACASSVYQTSPWGGLGTRLEIHQIVHDIWGIRRQQVGFVCSAAACKMKARWCYIDP